MRTPSLAVLLYLAACATGGGGSAGGGTAGSAAAPTPETREPAKAAEPEVSGASASVAPGAGGAGSALLAQTSEERRAAIDKQLDDSLGSFDAKLRKEQQQVASERDARRAAAAGDAAPEGAAERDAAADRDAPAGGAAADETLAPYGNHHNKGRDHSGDLKSEKTGKVPDDNAGNGAVAREHPDGSDDDVVARRLRQAAQQETDPELKEKLWQEYADYKKNAQGK
jgi:hypothetical protein